MNMKRNYVLCFCVRLGYTKVCLHTLKKEFKLRIGVKVKECTKAVLLEFSEK